MANNCFYEMKVKGTHEHIDEFLKVMLDYNYTRHFWRVFQANVYDRKEVENGLELASIWGDCAWSVCSCMTQEKFGTYSDGKHSCDTSLVNESALLDLEIEVFSSEYGMCFEEHYHYDRGIELVNDCVEACEFTFYPDDYEAENIDEAFKQFCEQHEEELAARDLSESELEDLKNGEYWLVEGGIEKDLAGCWIFNM